VKRIGATKGASKIVPWKRTFCLRLQYITDIASKAVMTPGFGIEKMTPRGNPHFTSCPIDPTFTPINMTFTIHRFPPFCKRFFKRIRKRCACVGKWEEFLRLQLPTGYSPLFEYQSVALLLGVPRRPDNSGCFASRNLRFEYKKLQFRCFRSVSTS